MRSILMFAAVLVAAGLAMAQLADRITAATPAKAANVVAKPALSGRSYNIGRDQRGHFQTDARIDGQRIGVMVDTGASVLAINETTAARIGVRPAPRDYTALVSTANGSIRGARTRIAMVEVGPLIVRDVDAMVLPDEALSENLLGLSFLSKLKRFAFSDGQLVLEQ